MSGILISVCFCRIIFTGENRIMWREQSVEELSDGRLYTGNDMVKIGTDDCRGCSDCCRMGPVIVLDPLDVFELNRFLQQSFEDLLNETIELKVIDGLILPVLKLVPAKKSQGLLQHPGSRPDEDGSGNTDGAVISHGADHPGNSAGSYGADGSGSSAGSDDEAMVCPYLGEDGRCTIHEFRPGICRLYPLGRSWENGDFRYILQVNECTHCTGSKVKVKKWLGIPNLAAYEDFCRDWHDLLEKVRHFLETSDPEGKMRRQICVYLIQQFFMCDWNVDDFYSVFGQRRKEALHYLGFAG